MVEIPLEMLSEAALTGLVDEFVTREGTDYDHRDRTLDEKREDVMRQLRDGSAVIVYDAVTATTHIVST